MVVGEGPLQPTNVSRQFHSILSILYPLCKCNWRFLNSDKLFVLVIDSQLCIFLFGIEGRVSK